MPNPSIYALLGHPVNHSPSPDLHNAWMTHHGVDGRYLAVDLTEDAGALEARLREGTYGGVNLTTPLKELLIGRLDTLTEEARVAGAVNTVVCRRGELHGANTDIGGFLDALKPIWTAPWPDTNVLVLGAGGAARAVAVAAGSQRARSVHVLNRTLDRAHRLVAEMDAAFPDTEWRMACSLDDLAEQAEPERLVVVDATSGAQSPWERSALLSSMSAGHVWMDLSYWRDLSVFAQRCEARGVRLVDGTAMLVHQAARAFQHFTGVAPDVTIAERVFDELQSIQDSFD